jgi:hypothetical protein
MKAKIKNVSLINESQDTVRVSSDYDRFIPHGLQRIIHSGHVKKIMGSMKNFGFLPSHPIAVFRDDDKFRIIDGHHRHAAAKSLGIPVRFVMLAKEFAEAVGDANTGKAWTTIEWARKHTLEGKKHFLTLNKYVVAGIPLLQAAAMLAGNSGCTSGGNVARAIITGEFVVRDTSQIDCIVEFIREFKGTCPAVAGRNFIGAFSLCYQTTEFDIEQFRARLTAHPRMLIKTANVQQMLEQIEALYNHGSRQRIPLAFIAREAASNRSPLKKGKALDAQKAA